MSERAGTELPTDERFFGEWQRWRIRRLAAVNAPDGPPTLAETYWLADTDAVPGVPGRWASRGGEVILTLREGETAQVETTAASGEIVALADGDEVGPRIHLDALTAQVTTRSGQRGVRVFDHARANAVRGIEAFEPSPDWVVEGNFSLLAGRASLSYEFALEPTARAVDVPGIVSFAIAGREYETRPFLDEGKLLLVFSDLTTGHTTKPPSRFLVFLLPGGTTREPGPVTLDFNRAFLPPCAFSDHFNCPLPPADHRFDVAVTAGETWARWAADRAGEGH